MDIQISNANKAKKLPQYLATACICIGAMGAGTCIAWTANITNDLKDGKLNDFKMDGDDISWAGSSMTIGATLMCLPSGWIANLIGRKMTVLVTTIPFVVGWIIITFAQHILMVHIGRALTGVGTGSFFVIAPLYTSEIAETEIRGRLGVFFQLFITIGILYAQIFGYAVSMMVYHFALMAVPTVFGILFLFQPETPTYLLKKGKRDKAQHAFRYLRGEDYDATWEINTINRQLSKEETLPSFWVSMRSKAARKASMICFTLIFYLQMSGINAVTFYANEIFTVAGSTLAAHWCVIIIGVVQVMAALFSMWTIDKLGRKVLLLISCSLLCLSSAMLGLFFSLKTYEVLDQDGLYDIGFLPVLSVMIFVVAFSMGLGPIPWVASAEMFPLEIKAKCISIAATLDWFFAFLITRFYLSVVDAIGTDMTFYIFAFTMLTAIFFTLFLLPETKGKTFAEIQAELEGIPRRRSTIVA